jgi:hypothetical protein
LVWAEREKDLFEVAIDFDDLDVGRNEIERSLGYLDDRIPVHFEEMVDNIILQLPKRCKIRAGYRLLDVKKQANRKDGLYLGDSFFKMRKIVTGQLRRAEKAALFVCTIGPAMETWGKQLMHDGEPAMSYLVDTVASVTVESVADVLHDRVSQNLQKQGLKITNRYSPGYCDWSVSEQHLLFSLLPPNFCDIALTDSALMLPIKSISGVIGAGAMVKRVDYFCDTCGMKDCTYRAYRAAKAGRNIHRVKS